jgi:hypothetical protein
MIRLRRMPSGNLAAWVFLRSKSLPAIVVRSIVANLLSTFDLASDLYTIVSLFALGHDGPASALLTMVCLSFAVQVRPGCAAARPVPTFRDLRAPLARCGPWCGRRR